ncbi:dihydrodipicolinate synthase family protein [Tichowtungia aerotolerans]|uniref:Dihydrodipicolinate synthase family protein n=1 Tax=Tichowtungia aerotolerans TaxID=2697043 RepID=A0A6P1MBC4_9BACT|nr:dihydrodipicolinate synthase family protein [Tichowtungia aerotolerans]QHI69398.1 hypothetical protein GT409_08010 [Tichowtungia aerotolerans]
MRKNISDGVWPVMLTPFEETGRIDWRGLELLTEWYISQGVHGLFSACLSSESLHLCCADKLEMVRRVVEVADKRVPVVAGVMGAADCSERIRMVRQVISFGADAAVMTLCDLVPEGAGDELWIEEMEQHLKELAGAPLGLYECPKPYHRRLTPLLTEYVTDRSEFLFLKETSGDLTEMERKSRAGKKSGLKIFTASAVTLREALDRGINGFSGLQANVWPSLLVKLFECRRENPELADRLQQFFIDYNWAVGLQHAYPAGAKLYLKKAHGLNIGSFSLLNGASAGEKEERWTDELVQTVRRFAEKTDDALATV